ncbi:ribosomal large subunit pseudouridine synthase B [Buchnera aphidicola (Cinara tujafilina)]|uniref:Pseudouridine synthase n=1 Tax=Buchnera aphidicola (Cinara tujafilina) TaxID=261317 RepID=F7WZB1_9GAMM|nr:pseudouridine synthase [Buchnera aphidicola]AEH39770.1 ribosomal large subunit pseudouridine synthase B [Buchnera aphidicola (Cinara tujafilina)]
MSEKIQKILSNLGYGSRRYIEKQIFLGLIYVNSVLVSIGDRFEYYNIQTITIKKNYHIKFDPKRVLLYNKPIGEICTRKDEKCRNTVFKNLPKLHHSRWINIGRLDYKTSGLLLFTNFGELAYRLMHPCYIIIREYLVNVSGIFTKKKMDILKKGVILDHSLSKFHSIKYISGTCNNKWFTVSLFQGKNKEVRRLWKYVEIHVNSLTRIRYGNIFLPKSLKVRKYIELNSILIKKIFKLVSLKY